MTIQNDFLAFAVGAGANVIGQTDYAANSALASGFVAGTAQSALCNKVWRQSSIMSAVIAQFIVAQTGQPVIDDGTTPTILADFIAAIESMISAANAPAPGDIKIWAGAVVDIPTRFGPGWYLANGQNGTINLTDKFIVGAGNEYAVGATGGHESVTLSVDQLPAHNHPTHEDPHSHGTTESPHEHTVSIGRVGVVDTTYGQGNGPYNNDRADTYTTSGATTGLTVNPATTGITVQNTGGGQPIDIRPPYYALCFVQYVGVH